MLTAAATCTPNKEEHAWEDGFMAVIQKKQAREGSPTLANHNSSQLQEA
jgi:hypothetical protein